MIPGVNEPPFRLSVAVPDNCGCPGRYVMQDLENENVAKTTFSMFVKALILACKSLALASCISAVFLSSVAVELIVAIVRFMRSGDWTIRDRVRVTVSETLAISPLSASCLDEDA